jgi:hypothetical protein
VHLPKLYSLDCLAEVFSEPASNRSYEKLTASMAWEEGWGLIHWPSSNSSVEAVPLLLGREVQLTRDLYGGLDGHRHRTAILVHFDHALYGLAILLLRSEMEGLLDSLKYENLVLCFYLTDCIGVETVLVEGNLTR